MIWHQPVVASRRHTYPLWTKDGHGTAHPEIGEVWKVARVVFQTVHVVDDVRDWVEGVWETRGNGDAVRQWWEGAREEG